MKLGFVSDTSFRKTELSGTGILRKFPESDPRAGIFGLKLPQVSNRAGIFGRNLAEVSRIGPRAGIFGLKLPQVSRFALESGGILSLPHGNVSG